MSDPQSFWDEVWARRASADERPPDAVLVDAMSKVSAGTALDLGCGDGTNAIWLAARGWTVSGVDLSEVALAKAASRAERARVTARVHWEHADLQHWSTDETFDLVTAFYLHMPLDFDATPLLTRAATAVRPGGTLLVVGHHTVPPWNPNPSSAMLPTAAEIVRSLGLDEPEWDVRRAADVPRLVHHQQDEATILDALVHAVRTA
jgi:2-polyprenyl-3-methyl-5-hydroxy-6-metoxy-1,4-benzoquinol methylase